MTGSYYMSCTTTSELFLFLYIFLRSILPGEHLWTLQEEGTERERSRERTPDRPNFSIGEDVSDDDRDEE
jgi:hypothetical protein